MKLKEKDNLMIIDFWNTALAKDCTSLYAMFRLERLLTLPAQQTTKGAACQCCMHYVFYSVHNSDISSPCKSCLLAWLPASQ